jgi:hypothetical protein
LEYDARALAFTNDINQACRPQLFNVMRESRGAHAVGLTQLDVGHGLSGRGDFSEHLNASRLGQNPTKTRHLSVRQSITL